MNRKTLFSMMAALGLMMSAAQAATQINALPCTISSPGTYVFTCNLTVPASSLYGPAIYIATSGAVVLDLKGFTLSMPSLLPNYQYTGISIQRGTATVRNGTIRNFNEGINASPADGTFLANITIQNLTFSNMDGTHIDLYRVTSSSVTNCVFTDFAQACIVDYNSEPSYLSKNRFDGKQIQILAILYPLSPVMLQQATFVTQ